ncbi:MAG: efflux RND transporter periplasmic adaptor subunit [Roseobacter sp.]
MSGTHRPSLAKRTIKRTVTMFMTVLIILGAGAAVFFGSSALQSRAAETALPDAAAPTPVSVRPLAFEDGYMRQRAFVGQVEPAAQIDMSFELSGRLVERTVDEGDHVENGQVVARLDVELLNAELEQLKAARAALSVQLDFAERQFSRSAALRQQGFSSVAREDEARASRDELQNRIIEIDAALNAVQIRLRKSVLRAPFSGQVGLMSADPGTTLAAGQPVLSLIEDTAPQVRVGLPLDFDPAQIAQAQIQIGGNSYPAALLHLRPDIDAETRTRTAIFTIDATEPLTFGRTASVVVKMFVEGQGVWMPLDALKEGDGGLWTILVVEDNRVRTAAVEVLHLDQERAYLRGSFEQGAQLVDAGAHRVVAGQSVRVLGAGG